MSQSQKKEALQIIFNYCGILLSTFAIEKIIFSSLKKHGLLTDKRAKTYEFCKFLPVRYFIIYCCLIKYSF